jgi:6-phosphogluconolactonase (cycloisomerase 2 family)
MRNLRDRGGWGTVPGAVATLCWASLASAQIVYVNNNIASPDNSVSALAVSTTGTLTPIPGSPFLTGGGGSSSPNIGAADVLTVGGFLYVSNVVTNTIAAFEISPTDGSLATVPGSPFPTLGTRPNGIAIDATAGLLFAADTLSNNVAVFTIASNGALTLLLNAPFGVAATPLDVKVDPAHALLFASHATAGVGVYTYTDALGGSVTAIGASPFLQGGTSGLRGLAINTAATRLYVANGSTSDVSGFSIGGGGTLTAVPSSPVAAGTGPTGVVFHPTKNVLYVSNDVSNDVYTYTIAGSGALTQLGSPSASGGMGTSGLAVDANNGFLFAVNGGTDPSPSRDVSVYSIDGTGALTAVGASPFSTGVASGRPASLALATITRPDCTAPAPGVCVPGKGKASTDCIAEWFVDTDPPPSVNLRTGLPDFSVGCQNGNPGCDFDALDSQCTFHVRVCINNDDPRFGCAPSNVATFQLLRPRSTGDAADADNYSALKNAMSGGTCNNDLFRSCTADSDCLFGGTCTGPPVIGVPFVKGSTTLVAGSTNSTPNLCSNVMDIVVPLRSTLSGYKAKTKRLRARVRTSGGTTDTDLLKLTCFPAP